MQEYKHLWRLLACVLFTITSVGCGNPNEDPPTRGPQQSPQHGSSMLYRVEVTTPQNCIAFGDSLAFSYTGSGTVETTIISVSVRMIPYAVEAGSDITLPFPELEHQLPLTLAPYEDAGPFRLQWDQSGYPPPDPDQLLHGVYIFIDTTYQHADGERHQVRNTLYVGIDYYTYQIPGGTRRKIACSDMEKIDS